MNNEEIQGAPKAGPKNRYLCEQVLCPNCENVESIVVAGSVTAHLAIESALKNRKTYSAVSDTMHEMFSHITWCTCPRSKMTTNDIVNMLQKGVKYEDKYEM